MIKQSLSIILSIFTIIPCFAFDTERCLEGTKKYGFLLDSLVSGTQFTSSFGDCSAIATKEFARTYIVDNELNLKQEIAIGTGEYLLAMDEVLNCPPSIHANLNLYLQRKTPLILKLSNEQFFQEINKTAEQICQDKS